LSFSLEARPVAWLGLRLASETGIDIPMDLLFEAIWVGPVFRF